jgi:hypothetical protein
MRVAHGVLTTPFPHTALLGNPGRPGARRTSRELVAWEGPGASGSVVLLHATRGRGWGRRFTSALRQELGAAPQRTPRQL